MQYIFITIIIICFVGTAGDDMQVLRVTTNYYFTEIGRNKKALVDKNGFGVFKTYFSDRSNANAIIIIITTRIAYYYLFFFFLIITRRQHAWEYIILSRSSLVSCTAVYRQVPTYIRYTLFTYISLFIMIPREQSLTTSGGRRR